MFNHYVFSVLMDKFRPGWRERARKRKSPWDFLCAIVGMALIVAIYYLLFLILWEVHTWIHPEHIGRLKNFWYFKDGDVREFAARLLILVSLFFPSVCCGFLATNYLFWLIPPARRIVEAEAKGDYELTFKGANAGLLRGLKWTGGVSLILALIGIVILTDVR
jgi:hypothetical protein